MSWKFADTHCHISRYPKPQAVLTAAKWKGVEVVAVTNTPDEYRKLKLRIGPSDSCHVALGLHPGDPASFQPGQLVRFLRMLPSTKWIGEIGLDYTPELPERVKKSQRHHLEEIAHSPLVTGKAMTLHSRGSAEDVLSIIAGTPGIPILHWYSGPLKLIDRALEMGCFFSVNSAMASGKRLPQLAAAIPADRLLLESDGPMCTFRGRAAEPGDIPDTLATVAPVWGLELEELRAQLTSNLAAVAPHLT